MTGGAQANPAYREALVSGLLAERVTAARARLSSCELCPQGCGVDRRTDAPERGVCGVGRRAVVSSATPHFGEERPLVGTGGSGTIFFAGCNLGCVFCQNHDISHARRGAPVTADELATLMLRLEAQGCHNINLVTPSHVVPQILEALEIAATAGLAIPLVYNTGSYDEVETLALMDGIVDIYMPDLKLMRPETAKRMFTCEDYPEKAKAAVKEMHRQVGDLEIDDDGLARRGVLLRHLVMPEDLSDTAEVCRFLVAELGTNTYLNLMGQYYPAGQAARLPELRRRPQPEELEEALRAARAAGLRRIDGLGAAQRFRR